MSSPSTSSTHLSHHPSSRSPLYKSIPSISHHRTPLPLPIYHPFSQTTPYRHVHTVSMGSSSSPYSSSAPVTPAYPRKGSAIRLEPLKFHSNPCVDPFHDEVSTSAAFHLLREHSQSFKITPGEKKVLDYLQTQFQGKSTQLFTLANQLLKQHDTSEMSPTILRPTILPVDVLADPISHDSGPTPSSTNLSSSLPSISNSPSLSTLPPFSSSSSSSSFLPSNTTSTPMSMSSSVNRMDTVDLNKMYTQTFTCQLCGFYFYRPEGLNNHMCKYHSNKSFMSSPTPSKGWNMDCIQTSSTSIKPSE